MSKFPGTASMRLLAAAVRSNTPMIWWGNPGQGKSAKIESAGRTSGYEVRTVVGSVRESTDFLGLPVDEGDRVTYAPPEFAVALNEAEKGLLFLDELTTSPPSTMKAMLRLIQERYAGDYRLADTVAIVAAANPPETGVDAMELPAPIANRLIHADWSLDSDEWLRGLGTDFTGLGTDAIDDLVGTEGTEADKARATSMVTGFLTHRRDLLAPEVPMDPVEAGGAWPSPRSWTNLRNLLAYVDPTDDATMLLAVKGAVGEGVAKEFFAWLAISDLHDPADVIENPSIVDWKNERPDRLFGLLSGVEALAVSKDEARVWEKAVGALTACAEGGKPDVALPAMRTLLNKRPKGTKLTQGTRDQFADLLSHTKHGFATAAA